MLVGQSYDPMKRAIDIVGSFGALLFLAPVIALTAALVRWKLGSPVLFVQQRPGKHASPFACLKFRTMTDARDPSGALLPDDVRLTPFGKFLRASSLDETPQLLNVLRGDMSFVGPRPLLMEYVALYSPEQARRHDVRPGMTGLAQVNGRNATTWDHRLKHDVDYVDNRSLQMDAKIVWKSVVIVLARRGISHGASVTMPRFEGSKGNNSTADAQPGAQPARHD